MKVEVTSRGDLRRWLAKHHGQSESVWLVTYKRGAELNYLPYDDIVEEALCFGWIDSVPRTLDQQRSMRLLSPRKAGSAWSAVNKARIARLTKAKLMHASGLAKVKAAKSDGSWSRIDRVQILVPPADLAKALTMHDTAKANFEAFPPSTKRAILEWIASAKTNITRQRRIDETASLAAKNVRANQYRQTKSARKA